MGDDDDNKNNDTSTPLRMGQFLDNVFKQLWSHNAKKFVAGFRCGDQAKTFEGMGELAANTPEKPIFRERVAEKYLPASLSCVLDIGLLIRNDRGVTFPTLLSKIYFAAHYIDVLLELEREELDNLINGPPEFWAKCYRILSDFSLNDLTDFKQKINEIRSKPKWLRFLTMILKQLLPTQRARKL